MAHKGFHSAGSAIERISEKRLRRLLRVDQMRREGLTHADTAGALGLSKSIIHIDLGLFRQFGEAAIRAEIAQRSQPARGGLAVRALKACVYIDPAFGLEPCGALSPKQYCPLHAPLTAPLSRPACSPRNNGLGLPGGRR